MRARLGLSTAPTTAPRVPRPHQSIPHNVIQLLGDGRGVLSQSVVERLLLASVVVGRWADSRWWLPLCLAWTTCWWSSDVGEAAAIVRHFPVAGGEDNVDRRTAVHTDAFTMRPFSNFE